MDEDRLSPLLGRLIDQAKAAVLLADPSAPRAEGIALLAEGGTVYTGYTGAIPGSASLSAVDVALASAPEAGRKEILAAALAVADDPAETVYPSEESRRLLAGVDPDLPLVCKQRGRWVVLPLSQLPPRDGGAHA